MGLAAEARGEGRGYRGRTYLGGGCVCRSCFGPPGVGHRCPRLWELADLALKRQARGCLRPSSVGQVSRVSLPESGLGQLPPRLASSPVPAQPFLPLVPCRDPIPVGIRKVHAQREEADILGLLPMETPHPYLHLEPKKGPSPGMAGLDSSLWGLGTEHVPEVIRH